MISKVDLLVLVIAAMLILCPGYAPSAETFGPMDDLNPAEAFDEDEEAFEEDVFEEEGEITGMDGGSGLRDFTFTFAHELSWATREPDPGIVTNRSSLRCEFDKSFWDNLFIKFDGKASLYYENDHVAEAGGKDADVDEEIREFYLQAGFDRFMVRAGKQVVVWGETDGGVINDVVSPRDESEFVFMDLEESRLGQYMASLDLYSDYGDFLAFVAFKPGFNETPDRGTRYYRDFGETVVTEKKTDFSDLEAGLKWKKIYDKFEISLMAASLRQNAGVLEHDFGNVYNKVHERYGFYAVGASYTIGSYLFKVDASFKHDYALQSIENEYQLGKKEYDISDAAFAVEYDANGRYTLNFELTNRHVFDYSSDLWGTERNNTGLYFQYNKKFLNDTLEFEYVLYHQFQENNSFHKTELEYSISDDIELTIEYVFFQTRDADGSLWHYRNEDRIGAEIKIYY